ncbi:MAG: hypothetical protein ABGY32_04380 [bacterium]
MAIISSRFFPCPFHIRLPLFASVILGACTPVDDPVITVSTYFPRTTSIDIDGVPAGGVIQVAHQGDWTSTGYVVGWVRDLSGGDEFEALQFNSEGFVQRGFYLPAPVTGAGKLDLAGSRAALMSPDTLWGEIQSTTGGWGRRIPVTHTLLDVKVDPAGGLSMLLAKAGILVLADVDVGGSLIIASEVGEADPPLGMPGLSAVSILTRVQVPGGASIPVVVARSSLGDLHVTTVNHNTDNELFATITSEGGSFDLVDQPLIHAADGSLWVCGSSRHGGNKQAELLQFTFDENGPPNLAQSFTIPAPAPFIDLEATGMIEAQELVPGLAGFFLACVTTEVPLVDGLASQAGLVCHVIPGSGVAWSAVVTGDPGVAVVGLQLGRPEKAAASNPLVVSAVLENNPNPFVTAFLRLEPETGAFAATDLFLLEQLFAEPAIQVGTNWLYKSTVIEGPGHGLLTGNMTEVGFWVTNSIPAGSPFDLMSGYGNQRLLIGMPRNEPALTSFTPTGPRGNAACVFDSAVAPLGGGMVAVGPPMVALSLDPGLGGFSTLRGSTSDGTLNLSALDAPVFLVGSTIPLCP